MTMQKQCTRVVNPILYQALHVVLNITTAPDVAEKTIFIPATLRTLMFATIGGINADNPDHLANDMNCIQSFDERLHVHQFFDLLTTADQLLIEFFWKLS